MNCIKCGKEIPDGELFCVECSLNAAVPLLEGNGAGERYPAPKGRMQTPRPVKRAAPQPMGPMPEVRRSGKGVKRALVIVSLLLALSLGFLVWQYGKIGFQRARLMAREDGLELRERALEDLYNQIDELTLQQETLEKTIADRDLRIQELQTQLAGSQSSQSQSEYDLTTKQTELDGLMLENQQLHQVTLELEEQIDQLTEEKKTLEAALEAAADYKAKADFMDNYVVFVENNGMGYYHTYDCEDFTRSNFWAYSRKLAEFNGYKPCPVCGGMP